MDLWLLIAVLVLIVLAIGALPNWAHMQPWSLGYFPSGVIVALLIVLAILAFSGRL